jgi:hypothetical protein
LLSLWTDEKKEEILKYSPAWSPIIPLNNSYHVTDDVGVSPDNKNKTKQDLASSAH